MNLREKAAAGAEMLVESARLGSECNVAWQKLFIDQGKKLIHTAVPNLASEGISIILPLGKAGSWLNRKNAHGNRRTKCA